MDFRVRLTREGNTWKDVPNATYHHETEEISRAFWGNGATAIMETCHFAMMRAPTRWTLGWPICPCGVELIQNDLGAVGSESAVGAHMDDKGPGAPVVLMLWCGQMKGFCFRLLLTLKPRTPEPPTTLLLPPPSPKKP